MCWKWTSSIYGSKIRAWTDRPEWNYYLSTYTDGNKKVNLCDPYGHTVHDIAWLKSGVPLSGGYPLSYPWGGGCSQTGPGTGLGGNTPLLMDNKLKTLPFLRTTYVGGKDREVIAIAQPIFFPKQRGVGEGGARASEGKSFLIVMSDTCSLIDELRRGRHLFSPSSLTLKSLSKAGNPVYFLFFEKSSADLGKKWVECLIR